MKKEIIKEKTCPFCFNKVIVLKFSEEEYGIGCNKCKCDFGYFFSTEEETIEWWNTKQPGSTMSVVEFYDDLPGLFK